MHICPLCGKQFRYYRTHVKQYHKDIDSNYFRILCYQKEGINLDELCKDYINLFSLTDLQKKYFLDFKSIVFILDFFNIKRRNSSESYFKITKEKNKITCLKKYGCENVSQAQEIKDKKAKTFLKHYGVDNIWKTKEYAEFTSKRWKSYSDEEKYAILTKNKKYNFNNNFGGISKLELKMFDILKDLNLDIISQFKFSDYYHKYDFKIKHTKILIEIYGDYWHANPKIYNKNQKIKYPNNVIKLSNDIWENDIHHNTIAESKGYKVIILWESDIRNKTNLELKKYIIDAINNLDYEQ